MANWNQGYGYDPQLGDAYKFYNSKDGAQNQANVAANSGPTGSYNSPYEHPPDRPGAIGASRQENAPGGRLDGGILPEERGEYSAYSPNGRGFEYGGRWGGADATVGAAYDQARMADQRQAYQMDPAQQNQARSYQNLAAGSYINTLNGRNPSMAQMQLQQGLGQSNANAGAMAASARGGGANLAAAQRNAMKMQATQNSAYNQQAGMLRAQEIAQAQQGLASVGGQMRGQDIGWQTSQGQLNQNQAALNDARNANYWNSAQQVNRDQLGANMAQEQLRYEADKDQRQQNYQVQKSNVDQARQRSNGIINSIGMMFGL